MMRWLQRNLSGKFSKREKIGTTLGIYFGYLCMGISMSVYGPALVDFTRKYDIKADQVSVIFTTQNIGYMIGCFVTGFIYKFVSRQLGGIVGFGVMALAMYFTPYCPDLMSLYTVAGLLGVGNGIFHAAGVVWVIEMWQDEAAPYIQGQHFFYTIGSLVASVLVSPFLSKDNNSAITESSKNERMWVLFIIVGFLNTVATIILLYLYVFLRYTPPTPEITVQLEEQDKLRNPDLHSEKPQKRKLLKVILIGLAAIFKGFYTAMVSTTNNYVSSFGQFGEQELSQVEGAQVMSAYTASFATGRGLGILVTLKVKPLFIVGFNLLALFVSNTLLVTIGNKSVGLWFGVVLLGLGFSSINGCFDAYMIQYVEYTNAISSLLLVSGSVLSSLFAFVVGQRIEENSNLLFYINLASSGVVAVAVIIIIKLTYKRSSIISKL